jgi:tetratricopeptide (TPR) repeat protein
MKTTVLACTVLALSASFPSLLASRSSLLAPRPSPLASGTDQAANPAIERDKAEARDHYQRGYEALHNEKYEVAEQEFQASIKLDPTFELSRYGLGQTYMAMKRYPDAVTAFQKCRDVFHANSAADASDQVARDRRVNDSIKELEDQKRVLQQVRAAPGSVTAGLAQSQVQQIDVQLTSLRDARHRQVSGEEPTPAWLSLALGSAYFRTNALADAEREYKNAITVNPKLGEAHNNLAVVYLMTNRASEASAELTAAEKAGFKVNPQLKEDVRAALAKK